MTKAARPERKGITKEGTEMKTKLASMLLAGAFSLSAFQAEAADKVMLQLKWVTQAQFAGYYVAKDKGFYEEEGLDVEIKPGGPDIAPPQVIAGGGADVDRRLDAVGACHPRKGRAAGQHRPAVQVVGHDADLPEGNRHRHPGRLQGQDARRLVLRQRISVPLLDEPARPQDRWRSGWRHRAQAGLQRRSAAAEAGRLHLDHDLQRILAGHRCRHQARKTWSPSSTRTRASRRWKTVSTCSKTSSRTRPSRTRWSSSCAPR